MKKSEKIISALVLMALGITFLVLKDNFIGILMTIAGVGFIVLGAVDAIGRCFPLAIIKTLSGALLIICGWAVVEAVLYILSGLLLVFGTLLLCEKIKSGRYCSSFWRGVLEYATPTICISIGILLLFHNSAIVGFVFIFSGVLTIAEGGILLFDAFSEE